MGILCVCTKLMKNDVVVVIGCVVDELMSWVFIIMDWWCELDCCWEFWWNFVGLLNYVEMRFWF